MVGPGFQIGRWRLERPLGDGGTSSVWRATEATGAGRRAAIKLIRWDHSANAELRFRDEARILQGLDHPGIVTLIQCGVLRDQGLLYLVMEDVEGEELSTVLGRGPMTPEVARRFFGALATALAHAHQQGVAHRDLKPDNVMVRPDGTPCVIDFGIALEDGRQRVTPDGLMPGTITYMPPEVFRESGRLDPVQADIYAVGVMLYEALEGREAFRGPRDHAGGTRAIIERKLAQGPLAVRPDLPRDLADVASIATHPDPTLRFDTMAVLASRLGATPPAPPRRPRVGEGPGTRWIEPADPLDAPPLPPRVTSDSPGAWGEAPETTFGVRRVSRDEVLDELRGTGSAASLLPEEPAAPAAPPEPPGPLPAAPTPPPVATQPVVHAAPADDETTSEVEALRVVLGVAAGVVLAVVAAAGLGLWWWSQGPPPERVLALAIAPPAGEVRLDGQTLELVQGVARSAPLPPGDYTVRIGSRAGCLREGGGCEPCCACTDRVVTVEPGEGEQAWPLRPDDPEPASREVEVEVTGVDDSPLTVRIGSRVLPEREGRYRSAPLLEGEHTLRVDAGDCPADEGGCADDDSCPPGCSSREVAVVVTCGEGTIPVEVDLPEPEPEEEAEVATSRIPRSRPEPSDDPLVEDQAPTSTPSIRLASSVEGRLDKAAFDAAMRRQHTRLTRCYQRALAQQPELTGRVAVDFKVVRDGSVAKSTLRQPSGQNALDACAADAVRQIQVKDSKPGTGYVVVHFSLL